MSWPALAAKPVALMILATAAVARAFDPAGMVYAQPGDLEAKVQGSGKTKRVAPSSRIAFGPQADVPDGSFRLLVDDGVEALELTGSYAYDGRNVTLLPDASSIAGALEDWVETTGDLPTDSVALACDARARTKIRNRRGVETATTRLKLRCLGSVAGVGEPVEVELRFRARGALAAGLRQIVVSPDGRGFQLAGTRTRFRPWGMNYGNAGRLMEDFWEHEWETLAGDFRELEAHGANVVRVHLQLGKFMDAPDRPNAVALEHLGRLLRLAEDTGLYLIVTGLGSYRPADVPAWYDALDEPGRWAVQAAFWEAVSEVGASSRAVFSYDLMNEPLSPRVWRAPGRWSSGDLFGEYDFVQYIALDPAGRRTPDIAVAWIRRMTAAIRKHDGHALVTVGLLPWSSLSGFHPEDVAPELDFISVHVYPSTRVPVQGMESLHHHAVGKPVLLEETFPLFVSEAEFEEFLRASREIAAGWLGHYDGETLEELDAIDRAGELSFSQAIYRSWLGLFVRLKPRFAPAS